MENLFSIWKKLVSNSQLEILLVDQKRVVVQKKQKNGNFVDTETVLPFQPVGTEKVVRVSLKVASFF